MLDVALAAVADADAVVVVGPQRDVPDKVTVLREDPPGCGPVPALAAVPTHATSMVKAAGAWAEGLGEGWVPSRAPVPTIGRQSPGEASGSRQ